MKSIIHQLMLASLFAVVSSVGAAAQDEPAAEPAQSPPPVESPPPVVESVPRPVVESVPTPAAEPAPAAAPSEPAAVSRPGRAADSPATEAAPRGERPSRGDAAPDSDRGGDRDGRSPERAAPSQGSVAQSGRSGRGPDRPGSGGQSQRDDGRRSQLGISIGPGGVQVFRGNPGGIGSGRGPHQHNFNGWNNGWDRGRGQVAPYSQQWYQGRGWGIAIGARPQVFVPSGPVIVTQPQSVQPAAPLPPEEPPVPTDEQLAGMPGIELRGLLLYAVNRLDEQLDVLSTGSSWKSFLKTDELRRAVPPPTLAPPPPDSSAAPLAEAEPLLPESVRRQMAEFLKRSDTVKQNPEFRQISQLWGFQTTHVVLRELLVPPIQRLRKQLALSVELLEQDLEQFETSSRWAGHLKLNDVKRIAAVRADGISPADRKQLQAIVSVFDSVAAEPSYRMISDLLGFRLTQYGARSYLAQLKVTAPPAPPAPPSKP